MTTITTTSELAQRTKIRAFQAGPRHVLIVAEGELPTPGFDVDIEQSPLKIFPPQFNLLRRPRPGIFPQVVTPYRHAERVPFPAGQEIVTVHHAEGSDRVPIEECGPELAAYVQAVNGAGTTGDVDEATGFSKNLSFDEAFADALANLPPFSSPVADALARVEVLEIGGLFGGFAGFHDLFVKVRRTHD
ncbi:MAG TPA: hypothetical protein VLJ59_02000 [Mycobacteriales bacterium]|nr:hypothetical protein [Mycobacteriales bacterium]